VTLLLGCPVTDDLLGRWVLHMVSPRAPFYLADDDRRLLPAGVIVLTRAELAADYADLPLEARDSYATYHVDHAGAWATLLDDGALDDLSPAARRALLRVQWGLGRGQIYDRAMARDLCAGSTLALAAIDPWTFDADGGDKVALQHRAWWAFPEEIQRRWLHWFVSRDRADCIASSLEADDWAAMDRRYRETVRHLAGAFLPCSGPNCFSTTLAAVTPGAQHAEAVSRLWLHQPPFHRALNALGFQRIEHLRCIEDVSAGTILVWFDDADVAQHACFVPAPGLALNKDAQGWFAPRQLVPLKRVLDDWQNEGLVLAALNLDSDACRSV